MDEGDDEGKKIRRTSVCVVQAMARRKKKCCSFTEILSLLEHLGKLYDFALGKVNFCPPLSTFCPPLRGGQKMLRGGKKKSRALRARPGFPLLGKFG